MKKSVKILIVVLILIIIGLATFIVVDKVINNKTTDEIVSQVENKLGNNGIVEDNTNVAKNQTKNEAEPNVNATKKILTSEEALTLGKEKYAEAENCYWDGIKYNDKELVNDIDEQGHSYYEITNINDIKVIFTTKQFSNFCNNLGLVEKNGNYYKVAADRGSDISYLGNELKVDNISENKITFTSIEKYCANEEDWGLEAEQVQDITTKENKFIIVKENETWKIDEFTLPN